MSSRADWRRLRDWASALAAIALIVPYLVGCGNDAKPQCAAAQFHVAVALVPNRVEVSLLNQGVACHLSGNHPIFVSSALHAALPANATGDVPAGATFVQPFAADAGMTCPANLAGHYRLIVSFEGKTVELTDIQSQRLAPSVDACMVLTPQPAHVVLRGG